MKDLKPLCTVISLLFTGSVNSVFIWSMKGNEVRMNAMGKSVPAELMYVLQVSKGYCKIGLQRYGTTVCNYGENFITNCHE